MLEFGDLVLARYWRWKHDPVPMVFILNSNSIYIEGLNSHYLTSVEVVYLRKLLYAMSDNSGNRVYYYLKQKNSSINRAYRKYFINLFVPLAKWKVKKIVDAQVMRDIEQFHKQRIDYSKLLSYDYEADRTWELLAVAEKREAKNAAQRRRYWLKKARQATNPRDAQIFNKIAIERGRSNPLKIGSILQKLKAQERANLGTLQDINYFGE